MIPFGKSKLYKSGGLPSLMNKGEILLLFQLQVYIIAFYLEAERRRAAGYSSASSGASNNIKSVQHREIWFYTERTSFKRFTKQALMCLYTCESLKDLQNSTQSAS